MVMLIVELLLMAHWSDDSSQPALAISFALRPRTSTNELLRLLLLEGLLVG